MPVYFFHLRDGEDVLLDPEGQELPGLDQAADNALREARAIIGEEARGGTIDFSKRLDVENEGGTVVHRLEFADAVRIVGLTRGLRD